MIMKTNQSNFPAKVMLAALLTAGTSLAIAQAVDPSAGTVPDSANSQAVAPVPNPAPARLTASIQPIDESVATRGEVVFIMVGDAVSVSGRISGLESNKRYQVVIQLPLNPLASQVIPPIPPQAPENQDAGSPQADAPEARQPDGEPDPGVEGDGREATPEVASRPPQATAGVTGSLAPSLEVDLGMMVSDAQGIANLNGTLMNRNLSQPPNGIQGCTLVIKRAPPLDSREERSPVGSGVIVASDQVIPVPSGR